jgi:chemotaxis protein histidine kinase CheA/methylmalonyl-CoA mutase cobalamin-binding subunit
VDFGNDPELQQMFVGEVAERSARLAEGALALRNGDVTPQLAGELMREGHTIKGTGRVMGYDHVATAGLMLEMIWRWIQHGDITPAPIFGRILEGLSRSLPNALSDPSVLDEAMAAVSDYFEGEDLPEALPSYEPVAAQGPEPAEEESTDEAETEPPDQPEPEAEQEPAPPEEEEDEEVIEIVAHTEPEPEPEPEPEAEEPAPPETVEASPVPPPLGLDREPEPEAEVIEFPKRDGDASEGPTSDVDEALSDLGGLIASVQDWAAEEIVSVNAGRLYGMVNHLVTLRMDVDAMNAQIGELREAVAADVFFSDRLGTIEQVAEPIAELAESIETEALELASVPVRDMTTTLPQLVSYLAKKTGNDVRLEVEGEDLLIDRQVLDMLDDAVRQLVVNGVVHGIEDAETRLGVEKAATGVIRVKAEQEESNLKLVVTDDGRGIDWKMIREKAVEKGLIDSDSDMAPDRMRSLLYHDGFSTLEEAGELAGDGMGMTLVRDAVEALNGSFRVESVPHKRTSVTITVPMHRAMQRALLVISGKFTWGIPEVAVEEVIPMSAAAISVTDDATIIKWDDKDIPFASFSDVVGFTTSRLPTQVVVVSSSVGQVALAVEDVKGTRQVAAKELGALLAGSETVTGAALLGGDEIALLVDTASLTERQRRLAAEGPTFASPRILIVDDSLGVQQVVSSALATSGFMTSVAGSVADALGALQNETFDALVVDFSMPRADGVALVHMVRQRHANTPIVMLSGVADEADIERAKQAGVDAFFDKSDFREGGLAEKLHELVAERREAEQTA